MNAFETYQSIARDQSAAAAERLFQTYEMAIEATARKNKKAISHCLDLLRHTLDFQSDPLMAHNLLLIYRDCEAALEEDKFEAVAEILERVRGLFKAGQRLDKLATTIK